MMKNEKIVRAIPSAAIVLVRQHQGQLEVLMLRKAAKLTYGGSWVFPGGKVDPNDIDPSSQNKEEAEIEAYKRAAVREAEEEAGIQIDSTTLHPLSHWTTPIVRPKRFTTWYFYSIVDGIGDKVVADGREITDAVWVNPAQALADHRAGQWELSVPPFLTLTELARQQDVYEFEKVVIQREPKTFQPRTVQWLDDNDTDKVLGSVNLYQDDSSYETGDLSLDGRKHRLYLPKQGNWRYVDEL